MGLSFTKLYLGTSSACSSTLLYLLTCGLHDGQQVASGVSSNRSFGAVPSSFPCSTVLAGSVVYSAVSP